MTDRTITIDGFTVREGRHAAGSSLPWHRHSGATLCFVYAGGFTERFAGTILECVPGTLKVTPAEEPHSNRFGREETRGLLVEADAGVVGRLGTRAEVLGHRASYRDEHLSWLAWRLLAEVRHADSAAALAIEGLLLEILAGLARARDLRLHGSTPRWVVEARDYLHDPGEIGSVGELAAAVGVHPVTLARGFRKAYGCTVGAYLRWLRLVRAARQLAETDAPLAEVAIAAGFADQSHFSNAFRRETGLSPSAFRRLVRPPGAGDSP
ncbi:MAG: helix-turn-helix domain-containing protein [Gemmatimonadales bacterium]